MTHQVRAVVARGKGAPVSLETILVPDPGPGEALVQVQACGVCHTDLHYREGGINDEFPFLLGHEAAGVVESVGEGVTDVAPGDFVILNWRAVCGSCRACLRGRPWYCFNTHNAKQKMTLLDGTELSPALGIGAFAEKTLVAAGQCTKVDPAASAAVAGLLGCGVMAGIGAAINTGNVGRGDTVAVIGCGGVGDAAVVGASLAGAAKIIAVDIDDRKLATARTLGATHTVNSKETDAVEAIQELTGGIGVDRVIDAVGIDAQQPATGVDEHQAQQFDAEQAQAAPQTNVDGDNWVPGDAPSQAAQWAAQAVAKAGTIGIIGVYPQTFDSYPIGVVMNKNVTVKTGNCNHRHYIPQLVAMVTNGTVDPALLLTGHEPMTDVLAAYREFDRREPGWIKIALEPAA